MLETAEGRGVRADFRCVSSAESERYVWEQELAGTPFERHLKALRVEIGLRERDGGTEVGLTEEQTLKGMSQARLAADAPRPRRDPRRSARRDREGAGMRRHFSCSFSLPGTDKEQTKAG